LRGNVYPAVKYLLLIILPNCFAQGDAWGITEKVNMRGKVIPDGMGAKFYAIAKTAGKSFMHGREEIGNSVLIIANSKA